MGMIDMVKLLGDLASLGDRVGRLENRLDRLADAKPASSSVAERGAPHADDLPPDIDGLVQGYTEEHRADARIAARVYVTSGKHATAHNPPVAFLGWMKYNYPHLKRKA
jgi:hypothetical protein